MMLYSRAAQALLLTACTSLALPWLNHAALDESKNLLRRLDGADGQAADREPRRGRDLKSCAATGSKCVRGQNKEVSCCEAGDACDRDGSRRCEAAPAPAPAPLPPPPPTPTVSAAPTRAPAAAAPTEPLGGATYQPGDLVEDDATGIRFSRGLSHEIVARTGQRVPYPKSGGESDAAFHDQPDAGACFPGGRGGPDGFVYASNSEIKSNLKPKIPKVGGVGAIHFDADGEVVHYEMVLRGTNYNCGGGFAPWGSGTNQRWLSCEENGMAGRIFEVDPYGSLHSERSAEFGWGEETCLGLGGGNFESVSVDNRVPESPKFFITVDSSGSDLRRYEPPAGRVAAAGTDTWKILTKKEQCGSIKYLKLPQDCPASGTFSWEDSKPASSTCFEYAEGTDVKNGRMYFTSKTTRRMFELDLDAMTYKWVQTTKENGVQFEPDQIKFISGGNGGILYFAEDGGPNCGIHGRDLQTNKFFSILQSTGSVYTTETTGLAFCGNKKFMLVSFQGIGHIFKIWRDDGYPFDGETLDIKYHA